MNKNIQRNTTIDSMRLIFSFLVVFLHIKILNPDIFYNSYKLQFIEFLGRFAVPFFFMVSGYYLFGKNLQYIKKQISKLFTIYLVSYFAIFLTLNSLNKFKHDWNFDITTIPNLIFLNNPIPIIWTGITWFIIALIYIYICFLQRNTISR